MGFADLKDMLQGERERGWFEGTREGRRMWRKRKRGNIQGRKERGVRWGGKGREEGRHAIKEEEKSQIGVEGETGDKHGGKEGKIQTGRKGKR